jgi:hypothetical protein
MHPQIKAVLDRLLDFKPRVRRQPDPRQPMLFGVLVETAPPRPPGRILRLGGLRSE